jgi:hypothetical protein
LKIGKPSVEDENGAISLKTAIAKLNTATTLLFRILSVLTNEWHPDAKLPELTKNDLDKSILDAEAAIEDLIDKNDRAKAVEDAKRGIVHNFGKGIKTVCVNVKPFLKTFLAVAVQGANVFPRIVCHWLILDSYSESFWVVVQWDISTY